ncbi:hypothetical protein AVI51_16465 (plasmid) [Piscirickettsia salmonis]|uniref:methyltransferase domain-containing protein n=1 Tax=Piscirickettsia salmonis TaxID=1238 RepID=UPI0006BDD6A2|nr:methyltransferase domain-containing protein [Piscirickettsia salmonis]ALA26744.1 ubiE/COQ5 methyltransferase family protein [Piscirickettsia salmonis]APS52529.1 hypothetical protein AVI50_16900 [Piscirickettsia salmonis]APS55696.1 hypothetical protein AVI51_16465 [Piscirickettsia salmonis]QGP34505.1 trans-aconitate 2-methyltransferase [Piscirickettsia salmonis]
MSKKIYKDDCQERLDTLQKIFDQQSLKFITDKLDKKNLKLLELGCRGNCDLIIALANKYPNLIEYTGIDDNPKFIKQAEKRLSDIPLKSLKLTHAMITDVSGLGFDLYDVIYSRLYFMYIQNYVEALKQVLNQLKVGGIIICEEPDLRTNFCNPAHVAYDEFLNLFGALGKVKKMNFKIGSELHTNFLELGLKITDIQFSQPVLMDEERKRFMDLSMTAARNDCIEYGLITPERFDVMINSLKRLSADERYYFAIARQTHISAIKA